MTKISNKALNDKLREKYLQAVMEYFSSHDEDVMRTNTNEIALPCVDEQGNEKFITITVKVPTGSREGDPYDGYSMAEEYKLKLTEKAEKAKAAAEAKAKKIARDEKQRAKQAEFKAKREAK